MPSTVAARGMPVVQWITPTSREEMSEISEEVVMLVVGGRMYRLDEREVSARLVKRRVSCMVVLKNGLMG
jgi:hypothetical protein